MSLGNQKQSNKYHRVSVWQEEEKKSFKRIFNDHRTFLLGWQTLSWLLTLRTCLQVLWMLHNAPNISINNSEFISKDEMLQVLLIQFLYCPFIFTTRWSWHSLTDQLDYWVTFLKWTLTINKLMWCEGSYTKKSLNEPRWSLKGKSKLARWQVVRKVGWLTTKVVSISWCKSHFNPPPFYRGISL